MRSNPHLIASVDIFTFRVTANPVLLFLVSKPPRRRPHADSATFSATLTELNAEGFDAQTVNDLLTMYVEAASQHVLRMSFVQENEARTFDTEVIGFWSQLIKRDATTPLFHLPLKLGGLGVCSAVQRHAAAVCRAWQSVLPALMAATEPPDADTLVTPTLQLRAQLVPTTIHTFTTDAQACPPLQAPSSGPPHQYHSKEACLTHPITPSQTTH